MARAAALLLAPLAAHGFVYGSIRSDMWNHDYKVHGATDPVDGRRIHIVVDGVAATSDADLKSVTIDGQEGLNLPSDSGADLTWFDWLRAHVNPATKQLWVSFHTRNKQWQQGARRIVVVLQDGTVAANATVEPAEANPLAISYATTAAGGTRAVLHIHSLGTAAARIGRLLYDGRLIPVPNVTVPAGGHVVVTVDGVSKKQGDIWTAVVFSSPAGVAYGGRVMPERFPVEVWPRSSDCPLPGGNDTNAAVLRQLGVDSVFYDGNNFQAKCGKSWAQELADLAAGDGYFHVFSGSDQLQGVPVATRTKVVDAVLIGDEVDGSVDAEHVRSKLAKSLQSISQTPELPVYQGSKTNRNVGAFCGISDVQGSDAYCAACAPTQLAVTDTLPLQYPYYWLRNARDNHAPLPFWGYSQLYGSWSYQANANELIAQIGQVVLSGSKGLMMFQSVAEDFAVHDIGRIGAAIQSIKTLGEVWRTGDILGVQFSCSSKINKEVMVETVLSPTKLAVAIVNTDASGYSNLLCHVGTSKHWKFKEHTIQTLSLNLASAPQVTKVTNWQEAKGNQLVPLADASVSGESGTVTFSQVKLDDKSTARFFVADVAMI